MGIRISRANEANITRCLLLAGVSFLALIETSRAADLPVAKAPPPAPIASWAGFYLGVHGGYGWARDDFSQSEELLRSMQIINGIRGQGSLYGAHGGYNWQFGRAVMGAEIDFDFTDMKGSNGVGSTLALRSSPNFATETLVRRESIKYLGSARGRLGWLPADNVLLYGTAGLAWERLDSGFEESESDPSSSTFGSGRAPVLKFGWVAGLGAEVMLGTQNWTGRLEYLHYDFETAMGVLNSDDLKGSAGSQTVDLVRAGLTYKFGEPAIPVPAAYSKAPIATAPATWTGFYIGAHGGYARGDDPFTFPMALNFDGTDVVRGTRSNGWIAGGQFGYNWQYDRFVTSIEADLSGANIKGNSTTGVATNVTTSFDEKVKYLGTLRGRLGWLPMNNVLLYGTAGLAWERFELAESDTNALLGTATRTNVPTDLLGWVAGVGGEVMLGSPNWIGRLEYLHYDFDHAFPDAGGTIASSSSGHQTIDLVRTGVSYKFGPDAPGTALAMYGKPSSELTGSPSWAGFYLGGHAGYGWTENDLANEILFSSTIQFGGIKSEGWLGGGQFGYNWQYARAVAGVEIDGTATSMRGNSQPGTTTGILETLSDEIRYLGTARGRVGWTPAADWLFYGTGGLAYEQATRRHLQILSGPPPSFFVNESQRDQFGWVAGAGVEKLVGGRNWIARLEYLHYDFDLVEAVTTRVSSNPRIPSAAQQGGRQTVDTVRAGLSYKFTP
jgi:opacity protein-like surface antigen